MSSIELIESIDYADEMSQQDIERFRAQAADVGSMPSGDEPARQGTPALRRKPNADSESKAAALFRDENSYPL